MGTNTPHPAKFSDPILEEAQKQLVKAKFKGVLLDPFAGVGKVHQLSNGRSAKAVNGWKPTGSTGITTIGVEIEPEWAKQHKQTLVGDSRDLGKLGFRHLTIDGVFTSPCYGNRMADHHDARDKSKRHTYRHYLGRMPTDGSAAVLQWGKAYRELHHEVWVNLMPYLKDKALFMLNISDHVRNGEVVPVTAWHKYTLETLGISWTKDIPIRTRRHRHGENHSARVANEWLLVGKKK